VPDVPDDFEEVGLPVLVLEVVGVLPGVEDEERDAGLRDVVLVVVDLRRDETLADRLPDERSPTRAHDRRSGRGELLAELFEAAEVARDRLAERAGGAVAPLRRQVLPE